MFIPKTFLKIGKSRFPPPDLDCLDSRSRVTYHADEENKRWDAYYFEHGKYNCLVSIVHFFDSPLDSPDQANLYVLATSSYYSFAETVLKRIEQFIPHNLVSARQQAEKILPFNPEELFTQAQKEAEEL